MARMSGWCTAAISIVVMLSAAGCDGSGSDDSAAKGAKPTATTSPPDTVGETDPAVARAQPAKVNVERFLMQAGEEPGFDPIDEPRTDHGVQSLAGGFSADEVERLRRAGFISITFQPLSADDHNAGVTTVLLFKTAEGARDWLEYETSDEGIESAVPGAKPKRFTVRGVPGARGWTGRDRHGNPIGHVFWVQGRCEMVLGNEGEGDFVKPLSIGAKAMYDRAKGVCPA